MNWVPELNDLVREAFDAQESFDAWDEGKTYCGGAFSGPRYCTLAEVDAELDAANLRLVRFVLAHGADLVSTLSAQVIEAQRAETPKSGSVHESAAPEGGVPK